MYMCMYVRIEFLTSGIELSLSRLLLFSLQLTMKPSTKANLLIVCSIFYLAPTISLAVYLYI